MTPTPERPEDDLVERLTTKRSNLHGDWIEAMEEAAFHIRTLEAEKAELVKERDEAIWYATSFAQAFSSKHFPDNAGWRPLPDMLGLLTQIDNMTTITNDYKVRAEAAEARVTEVEGALRFYADPDSYVALVIWGDSPCGEFIRDLDADYDHETYPYERPMPGSRARAALKEHGDE